LVKGNLNSKKILFVGAVLPNYLRYSFFIQKITIIEPQRRRERREKRRKEVGNLRVGKE
jgi:hypothetical protein